jgi:hypothetical protein
VPDDTVVDQPTRIHLDSSVKVAVATAGGNSSIVA